MGVLRNRKPLMFSEERQISKKTIEPLLNRQKEQNLKDIAFNEYVYNHIKDDLSKKDVKEDFVTEETEKVNDNLRISNKEKKILFKGQKARMLTLKSIEKDVDTNKIVFIMETIYKDQIIELKMDRESCFKKNELIKLSGKGADIDESNAKYHIQSLKYQEENIEIVNTHTNIGYFKKGGKEIIRLNTGISTNSIYSGNLDLKEKGNIEEYLKDLKQFIEPYTNISIAFLIGCTSILVSRLSNSSEEISTLLAHFAGDSSKGKSTATMLAISVWGNPSLNSNGLYNSWNSTENAILTSLCGNNGIACAFDELSSSNIENFTKLIYNMVAGKDKLRVTKNINLIDSGSWITTIISNGESSILNKSNKNTGLKIRVLEFNNTVWTNDAKHADDIKKLSKNNYGVFGYEFSKAVLSYPIEELKSLFESEKKKFKKLLKIKCCVDDKVDRTSSKYALITLAGEIIKNTFLNELKLEEIRDYLAEIEKENIHERGLENSAEYWLRQMIEENSLKFRTNENIYKNDSYWGTIKNLDNNKIEVSILKNKFEEIMNRDD
ncbi:TPA: DUF927 domain-containing protein [Clostridioides difficile]|nr:DUF927 domain-containing protein [Clostridioides difficile]